MLKLHGFAISNYFNMVKLALLEKGIDFEIVKTFPGQNDDHLDRHPAGKVPAIETEYGFLGETSVILDYIEQAYPQAKSLMPKSLFEQARVKELMQIIQLYLELPARQCFKEVFFGGKVSSEIKENTHSELKKGIAALQRRSTCTPYLAGADLTLADIVFVFTIDLACMVSKKLFNWSLLEDFPEAKKLVELLNQRPHVIAINAEKEAELAAFIESKKQSSTSNSSKNEG